MRAGIVFGLIFLFVACAEDQKGNLDGGSRADSSHRERELTPEKREALLKNDLFTAVYNNQLEEAEKLAYSNPKLLDDFNDDGDTPLGLALTKGFRKIASLLLERTPTQALFHQNHKGESYLYLASRAGFPEIVTQLGQALASVSSGVNWFRFESLDLPAKDGSYALFVASDRQVAKALEDQFARDLFSLNYWPLWDFVLKRDLQGRDFLHYAARDNRADLIDWAAQRLCASNSWKDSNHWIFSYPGIAFEYGWHLLETYTNEQYWVGFPTAQLFNRQDEEYKTPLHFAVENGRWDAMRALATCQWTNYDLPEGKNARGSLPLGAFLQHLDAKLRVYDQETHDAFIFLLQQRTSLRKVWMSVSDHIDYSDSEGNTALHFAARLADPFFYQAMANMGNTRWQNKQGLIPEVIFRHRQSEVAHNRE